MKRTSNHKGHRPIQKLKGKMKKTIQEIKQEVEQEALSILKKADNAMEEVAVLTEAIGALTGDPVLGNISIVAADAQQMIKDLEKIDEDLIEGKSMKDDLKNTAQDAAGLAVCFVVNKMDDVSNIMKGVKSAAQDLKNGDVDAVIQDTTSLFKSATDLTGNPLAKEAAFIVSATTQVILHVKKNRKKDFEGI